MDAVDRWMSKQDSAIAPERQQSFIGVQSPHFVDATADEASVSRQTKITEFTPSDEREKKNKGIIQAAKDLMRKAALGDVSGDAPDCNQEIDQFLTSRGNAPSGIGLDDAMKKLMFIKEKKEHPTLDDETVMQIVEDHIDSGDY